MSVLKKLFQVVLVVILAYGVGRFIVVFRDSQVTGYRAPYLQMLTPNSVVVRWVTEDNQLGVVHFGVDRDNMGSVALESSPTKDHTVKLPNLEPGTRYFYQVDDVSGVRKSDDHRHWFYTSPAATTATRIWVLGDSGTPGEVLNQVKDAAFSWMKNNPLQPEQESRYEEPGAQNGAESDFADDALWEKGPFINVWMSLGDIAYRSGSNQQYQKALFDTFADLTPITALWPVYGNHDDRRWTYFKIFDLPEHAEAGGVDSGSEHYYAMNYSNIHFVMLDTQDSDMSPDGAMAQWLKLDLSKNDKPWVIAAFHHPPYTKGTHDSDDEGDSRGKMTEVRKNILPILEQGGVDLVLSGHSHMYERSYLIDCAYADSSSLTSANIVSKGVNGNNREYIKPLQTKSHQGAVYVVAGSSSKVDQGSLDHPANVTGFLEAGSLVIDVVNDELTMRFINSKGEVRDEVIITKQADYSSNYPGCM